MAQGEKRILENTDADELPPEVKIKHTNLIENMTVNGVACMDVRQESAESGAPHRSGSYAGGPENDDNEFSYENFPRSVGSSTATWGGGEKCHDQHVQGKRSGSTFPG